VKVNRHSGRSNTERKNSVVSLDVGPPDLSKPRVVASMPTNKQRLLDVLPVTLSRTPSILNILSKAESSIFVSLNVLCSL
jgi:hypothetical protein